MSLLINISPVCSHYSIVYMCYNKKTQNRPFKLAPVLLNFHKVSKEQSHIHSSASARKSMWPFACTYVCKNGYSKWGQGKKALEFPYELGNPGSDWRRKQETCEFAWEVEVRNLPQKAKNMEGAFAYNLSEFVYAGAGNVRYKGQKHVQVWWSQEHACHNCTKVIYNQQRENMESIKHIANFGCVKKKGHQSLSNSNMDDLSLRDDQKHLWYIVRHFSLW